LRNVDRIAICRTPDKISVLLYLVIAAIGIRVTYGFIGYYVETTDRSKNISFGSADRKRLMLNARRTPPVPLI